MTLEMQSGTRIYLSGFSAVIYEKRDCKNNIKIIEKTTIQTAAQYANSTTRMAVLNFANAYSPGGGVENGDMAQEESLCRSSNLYYALTIPYVVKHYYKKNVKMIGDMGTDDVIYSPGVTVIKTVFHEQDTPGEIEACRGSLFLRNGRYYAVGAFDGISNDYHNASIPPKLDPVDQWKGVDTKEIIGAYGIHFYVPSSWSGVYSDITGPEMIIYTNERCDKWIASTSCYHYEGSEAPFDWGEGQYVYSIGNVGDDHYFCAFRGIGKMSKQQDMIGILLKTICPITTSIVRELLIPPG